MTQIDLQKPLALDGGFGYELIQEGLDVTVDPLWSSRAFLANPDLIVKIHKKFLSAGVDILTTNSYSANINVWRQEEKLTREEATDVVRQSVRLARKAMRQHKQEQDNNNKEWKDAILAGAIGPYATTYHNRSEYTGWYVDSVDQKTMVDYFYNQALPLIEEGVDMLAFETVPALAEAQCILKALDLLPPDSPPAWIAFACREFDSNIGPVTNHGESFSESIEKVSGHGQIVAVGVNCTMKEYIHGLLEQVEGKTHGKPLVVYPDGRSFNIHDVPRGRHDFHKRSATSEIAGMVPEWIQMGARIIGGCCGVQADETAVIARVIQTFQ